MDAIILAAGLGTRLRPHTLKTPKPLLPVQGRPILDWTLAALPPAVDRVVVVVYYLSEQIKEYLAGQAHVRDWVTVRQEEPRGTGHALLSCRPEVRSDRFLVLNGDDLYGAADLAALSRASAAILAREVAEPRRFGVAFTRTDGTLERIVEKPDVPGPRLANAGAYTLPQAVFDLDVDLSARGEYEITDYVTALARRQPVEVIPAEFWLPIGTVEAWQQAERVDLSPMTRADQ